MSTVLVIKALIGALIIIDIQLISQTKNYCITALVPSFTLLGLIAYYTVGSQRGVGALKNTLLFVWCH